MRQVFASLYNDRAISYRVHKGYAHGDVALSAGVQRMVRSDLGSAGVMFTMDTESGFTGVVFITSSYGLGETVVQGAVNPDEFYVHKTALQGSASSASSAATSAPSWCRWNTPAPQRRAPAAISVKTVDTVARAAQPLLADGRRGDRTRRATP